MVMPSVIVLNVFYAECYTFKSIMMNVVKLSIIMLNVDRLNVVASLFGYNCLHQVLLFPLN